MKLTTYRRMNFRLFRSPQLVVWGSTGEFTARARTVPANPRTKDQMAARNFLTEAKRVWNGLSTKDKKGWSDFAGRNHHVNKREIPVRWRGIDAFCRSSVSRQIAALPSL